MPQKRLPARLKIRHRAGREPRFVIVDGATEIDTGCGVGDRKGAEARLGDYIAASRQIDTSSRNPAQVSVADVIALYLTSKPAAPACYHGTPLLAFFGLLTLKDINGALCRRYADERGRQVAPSTVRRELGTLQAAINHWHVESPLDAVPRVWKPEEAPPQERVLTRAEVARMLQACRVLSRTPRKGGQGAVQLIDYRHVARFILIALYTGTRHQAITDLGWYESDDTGWLDPLKGIIHRAGRAERKTRKRRDASRIPDRLLAHVRRWARLDLAQGPQAAVVRFRGKPVDRMQRSWRRVVKAAGLGNEVTPHVLKHTAATWLLSSGVDIWATSGLTSTSTRTLEARYGHHSPEFQRAAAGAFRKRA